MRKVLLVSYTFPPQYDVSARRAAKLCKYLPAAGWQPVVLTKDWAHVAPEDHRTYAVISHPPALDDVSGMMVARVPYHSHDNALRRLHARLGGVYGPQADAAGATGRPHANGAHANGARSNGARQNGARQNGSGSNGARQNGAATRRWTPGAVTRRALSLAAPIFGDFPDAFRGWTHDAVRTGIDIVNRESIDAIVSLCPPATAHVVASEIARATGVPWVAQFDDLYSFHLERQRPAWRRYGDWRHRRWMSQASLAGAITPAMLAYVRRTYGVDGDVVMVGFDPDESPHVDRVRGHRFRLAYTGSVYPRDQRPELFFEALEQLILADPRNADALEVLFVGTGRDEELKTMLASFPAAARLCTFQDRQPPETALRAQREADALVLFNCTAPSASEGTLSYPAKTFEYLNARRPILAIPGDPGGWGDRLLETTRAGVTARSPNEAAAVIFGWLERWRSGGTIPYHGDDEQIGRYTQPRQAEALGRLLDRAVATRQAGAPV